MTMTSYQLKIRYKDQTFAISVAPSQPLRWLKKTLHNLTGIPAIQQQLSYGQGINKKVLSDNQCLFEDMALQQIPGLNIIMKNLGSQVKWKHVFYIEYLGPILILPLFYFLGNRSAYTHKHTIALVLGVAHYLKRQYETAYIHIFSRQSMPFKRVVINSLHYWVLFALFNAVELYCFQDKQHYSHTVYSVLVALWVAFQVCNYKCHQILGSFRSNPKQKQKADSKGDQKGDSKGDSKQAYTNPKLARQIPYGWGFNLCSSANYFWQALCWLTYSAITRNYTAYLFTLVSIVQMLQWAIQKHRRYRKEFGEKYPKGRKAMFPFII